MDVRSAMRTSNRFAILNKFGLYWQKRVKKGKDSPLGVLGWLAVGEFFDWLLRNYAVVPRDEKEKRNTTDDTS